MAKLRPSVNVMASWQRHIPPLCHLLPHPSRDIKLKRISKLRCVADQQEQKNKKQQQETLPFSSFESRILNLKGFVFCRGFASETTLNPTMKEYCYQTSVCSAVKMGHDLGLLQGDVTSGELDLLIQLSADRRDEGFHVIFLFDCKYRI